MKRFQITSFAFVLVTLLTAGQSPISDRTSQSFRVVSFEFGAIDRSGKIVPSLDVSVAANPSYGWRLIAETEGTELSWKEVMSLPAPAKQWGVGPTTIVSPDKRVATTRDIVVARKGRVVIEQYWSYADGDPFGPYSADVFLDGERVRLVNFTVRP